MNFYNDIDPVVCAWTQQLINEQLVPPGVVCCKSITEIRSHEIKEYNQVHFFNGIAGWARALDLAGWPTTRPVWCASLPCQSFSCAGQGKGIEDARGQLWFPFLELVRKCRPECVFGEQVKEAINFGWLDRVFNDLEAEGYTCGAAVLGAHSIGAPHRRQRLYWVGHTKRSGQCAASGGGQKRREGRRRADSADGRTDGSVANTAGVGNSKLSEQSKESGEREMQTGGRCLSGGMEHPSNARSSSVRDSHEWATGPSAVASPSQNGFWSDAIWIPTRDPRTGKTVMRRASPEPEVFPLADGLSYRLGPRRSSRSGILKGAGNAIVPEVAAEFIRAYLEATKMTD